MKNYLAEITFEDPYPKRFSFRVSASNIGLAIYRAFKQFKIQFKGRRVKKLICNATLL